MSITKSKENQILTGVDDDIANIFDDFQNTQKVSTIYDFDAHNSINNVDLSVQDVISEVTIATRALQKADKVVNKRKPNLTSEHSDFVPISSLQPKPEVPKQVAMSKFETQCFSNTQLIDVVENAEAIYESRKGITQEFDVDFASSIPTSQRSIYTQEHVIKDSRSPSPVLGSKKSSNNSTPGLTVNLDVFEKFENIATSLINSNKFNIEEVKGLVDAKILNHELEIHGDNTNTIDKYDSTRNLVQGFKKNDVIQKEDDSTTASFLDDEILFSSDEEEYIHKDVKDLPSTCELSMSDNESEILDKTLYVGFVTANNRPIQITSESYSKANNIFSETVSEKNYETSPVLKRKNPLKIKAEPYSTKHDIAKNAQPKTPSNKKINMSSKPQTRADIIFKLLKDEPVSASMSKGNVTKKSSPAKSKSPIIGSHQMNTEEFHKKNKEESVLILEEDLFAGDLSFNDLGCTQDYKELSTFKDIKRKSNEKLSDEVLEKTNHWFNNIDAVNNRENALMECNEEFKMEGLAPKFEEFKTANNKKIGITYTALARTRHVLENFKEDEELLIDNFNIRTNVDIEMTDITLAQSKEIFKDVDEYSNKYVDLKDVNFKIEGMKIAPDKSVSIVNKAIPNTICSFHNIDELNTNKIKGIPIHSNIKKIVGFETASNKNFEISEKALAMSKHIFQGIDGDDIKLADSDKEVVGFKTVSNKNVQISEKALAMSKHIFQGIDGDDIKLADSDKEVVGFKTASNKNVQISEKALAMSKHIFQGIDGDDIKLADSDKEVVGFKTASNKNVQISEKALAMSKHIFQGIDGDDIKLADSDKEVVGFKTASNKKVQISEKALAMSKHIFQGIDEGDVKLANSDKEVVGFKTASNKKVQISEKALAMSKHIFQGIDEGDVKLANSDKEVVGFKTASNKKVQISEKALAMSKHIFQGIDEGDVKLANSDKEVVGFKTASNKNIHISEESLVETRRLFKDIVEENTNDIVVGFKTASNKEVQISEEAIFKTKHLFKNIDVLEQEPITETNLILGETLDMLDDDAINMDLKSYNNDISAFSGFLTANNETVKVSDEALVKSKNLFKEIDTGTSNDVTEKFEGFKTGDNNTIEVSERALVGFQNLHSSTASKSKNCLKNNEDNCPWESNFDDINDEAEMSQILKGFCTGNNQSVRVSKEAVLKTKNYFKDPSHKNNNGGNDIISNIFDTQIAKDFEDNMCTEDFCKEPQNLKRPASPILNFSKVKRMKLSNENEKIQEVTAKFDQNYKQFKTMTLKDLEDNSNVESLDPFILKYDIDTIFDMEFEGERNKLTNNKLTIVNIINIFKESVNKSIIPDGWMENHVKLIIWKLVSYEIKFPNKMKNVCNVSEILNQLKYRYDRELYNVERPALRKILEKDESSAKTLILSVGRIFANNVSVSSITNKNDTIELEVTDGWYCLRAVLDRMLTKLVHQGKIAVGTKIVTQGAELVNCAHGLSPWENTANVRLKLSANSTRRARWHSKLGFCRGGITAHLPHVMVGGGRVPKMRVFVSRVYPLLYVERLEDGTTVTRSERQEELYQIKYETERHMRIEKMYEELARDQEVESQCPEPVGEGSLSTGSQLDWAMRTAKDPEEFRATLRESQLNSLHDYQTKKRDSIAEDLRKAVNERLKTSDKPRSVISMMKIRVYGYYTKNVSINSCGALLSVWRVDEEILETLSEGQWVDLYNVVPTGMRNSELQLSAGRQSLIDICKSEQRKYAGFTKQLRRKCVKIADFVANPNMISPYNEFDITGLIFHIEPTTEEFETRGNKENIFQNVYLTDREMKFVCVNFWGGIKKAGVDKMLTVGDVVAGVNLRTRIGNSMRAIPQFRFLETSYFTKCPKYRDLITSMDSMVSFFSRVDVDKFCKDCVCLKSEMSLSKYKRIAVSPMLNKALFDSPLANNWSDFDFSAADFESTFKQSQSRSPSALKKSMVNEKIEKLRKMYGEPPPLSPICIKNKGTNVAKSYKSPFSITHEANIENQREVEAVSPVLKRRSLKRVFSGNPVKLDFCQNANLPRHDSNSPPMSLE